MPWVPNITSAFHTALACFESTCVAEACSTNTEHDVASLATGNNDVASEAGSGVFTKPIHETTFLFSNAFQIAQVICMQMLLMTTKHLGIQQFLKILVPQFVLAAWRRTSDLQPLLIDSSSCPLLSTRPTESMTACMIVPMLILA